MTSEYLPWPYRLSDRFKKVRPSRRLHQRQKSCRKDLADVHLVSTLIELTVERMGEDESL